ncbi:phospholipase D-like domain-containing protein [Actinophytocola sp.]|uniref:phospholipase D-like domain-containing protein n=1 Tax=Actinophytocola sp. TaxID=1872138 RepID=UPI002D6234A1|nr:phospholipase D-like domain-containing protein [Actinophytocola sp.]HYQ67576.1 phospholipase D-like domain-containing protein [Actinophytocola sp.]
MRKFVVVSMMVAAALVPAKVSAATPLAVTTEAVFTKPTGTEAEQRAIVNRVISLIDGAAAGSRIRVALFYADDNAIPTALVAARNRGVSVQAIFDHRMADTGESAAIKAVWAQLVSGLGTDRSASSWVMTCPAGRGCVGTLRIGTVAAINHNKFFLFSNTSGTSNVVVQSSANLHNGRDGTKGYNNALIMTGHTALFSAYEGYFGDMAALRADNNYYDTGRPPVTDGNAKIHFFPRATTAASQYRDPTEDTMYTVLDHIDCFGNTSTGTTDNHRTIIRVNQHAFTRPYLAEKLVELDAAGCYVEVVQNYAPDDDSSSVSLAEESLRDLLARTGSAYNGVLVRYYCDSDPVWTHSKYLLVEGKYYGVADRRIVWTGSANFSTNSLRQSDETVLQLEDSTVFGQYLADFRAARDSAPHQPANGAAITC